MVIGFQLADGTRAKAMSGIDDNSRFVVSAKLVRRAWVLLTNLPSVPETPSITESIFG